MGIAAGRGGVHGFNNRLNKNVQTIWMSMLYLCDHSLGRVSETEIPHMYTLKEQKQVIFWSAVVYGRYLA